LTLQQPTRPTAIIKKEPGSVEEDQAGVHKVAVKQERVAVKAAAGDDSRSHNRARAGIKVEEIDPVHLAPEPRRLRSALLRGKGERGGRSR
jgi:hypothetical protein